MLIAVGLLVLWLPVLIQDLRERRIRVVVLATPPSPLACRAGGSGRPGHRGEQPGSGLPSQGANCLFPSPERGGESDEVAVCIPDCDVRLKR